MLKYCGKMSGKNVLSFLISSISALTIFLKFYTMLSRQGRGKAISLLKTRFYFFRKNSISGEMGHFRTDLDQFLKKIFQTERGQEVHES